jgi:hypothetical protein
MAGKKTAVFRIYSIAWQAERAVDMLVLDRSSRRNRPTGDPGMFLTTQLHELLIYLGQRGVATILIAAHQGAHRQSDAGTVTAGNGCDPIEFTVPSRMLEAERPLQ